MCDPTQEKCAVAAEKIHSDTDPWAHRASSMRCATCMWFVCKEKSVLSRLGSKKVGRCRRHAPTMGGYPVVYDTDWCGDHRIDENRV